MDTLDQQFLALINAERTLHGLAPVTLDLQLDNAAQDHINDIAINDINLLDPNVDPHIGSNGSPLGSRVQASGYQYQTAVENIGAGQYTATEVFDYWKNSPLHRDNILNPSVTHLGVGHILLDNDTGVSNFFDYWTIVLGVRLPGTEPVVSPTPIAAPLVPPTPPVAPAPPPAPAPPAPVTAPPSPQNQTPIPPKTEITVVAPPASPELLPQPETPLPQTPPPVNVDSPANTPTIDPVVSEEAPEILESDSLQPEPPAPVPEVSQKEPATPETPEPESFQSEPTESAPETELPQESADNIDPIDSPESPKVELVLDPTSAPTSTHVMVGTSDDDTLEAGPSTETVAGGLGNDQIVGNDGDNVLRGDLNQRNPGSTLDGDDVILGGAGNDRIGGKGGDDLLFGGEGDDTIWGDDGDDVLRGGLGNDTLTGDNFSGGSGADIFILAAGEGMDLIMDFEVGIDLIGLADGLSLEDLSLGQSGNWVRISMGDEVLAEVKDVGVGDLGEGVFVEV
ncbi:MAG: CAP domain-containing protein [Cyanobacteria bacterium P01_D01_bin.2]